jgi:Putative prokaryotic signal transducing protein
VKSGKWWHRRETPHTTDDTSLAASRKWVIVASTGSPALAGMYLDLLRQAGIPVHATEWGGGSAALGGVPVGMTLSVPPSRFDEAEALLGLTANDEDGTHE